MPRLLTMKISSAATNAGTLQVVNPVPIDFRTKGTLGTLRKAAARRQLSLCIRKASGWQRLACVHIGYGRHVGLDHFAVADMRVTHLLPALEEPTIFGADRQLCIVCRGSRRRGSCGILGIGGQCSGNPMDGTALQETGGNQEEQEKQQAPACPCSQSPKSVHDLFASPRGNRESSPLPSGLGPLEFRDASTADKLALARA